MASSVDHMYTESIFGSAEFWRGRQGRVVLGAAVDWKVACILPQSFLTASQDPNSSWISSGFIFALVRQFSIGKRSSTKSFYLGRDQRVFVYSVMPCEVDFNRKSFFWGRKLRSYEY